MTYHHAIFSGVQANMLVKFCQALEVLTNDQAYLTHKRFYSSSLQKNYNSSYIQKTMKIEIQQSSCLLD